jgi:hypothetical protein
MKNSRTGSSIDPFPFINSKMADDKANSQDLSSSSPASLENDFKKLTF